MTTTVLAMMMYGCGSVVLAHISDGHDGRRLLDGLRDGGFAVDSSLLVVAGAEAAMELDSLRHHIAAADSLRHHIAAADSRQHRTAAADSRQHRTAAADSLRHHIVAAVAAGTRPRRERRTMVAVSRARTQQQYRTDQQSAAEGEEQPELRSCHLLLQQVACRALGSHNRRRTKAQAPRSHLSCRLGQNRIHLHGHRHTQAATSRHRCRRLRERMAQRSMVWHSDIAGVAGGVDTVDVADIGWYRAR